MHTLEPRVLVANTFWTAPDGVTPDRWVLFDTDGIPVGEWRTLEAAERELSGLPYLVLFDEYAEEYRPSILARVGYLIRRIITPIR